ncbi:hypothetical protein CI1B_86070 [Bradyrhizobium ivorense]|uniref:Uncharacterized protein n=1 Tax=Bradyrhizobium ivorense TaxID=2511166 RepID=A0A508U2A1_9BRAD|nr:hypothetical protein CI1B_86070 [Bradyrhizobium ivorense]
MRRAEIPCGGVRPRSAPAGRRIIAQEESQAISIMYESAGAARAAPNRPGGGAPVVIKASMNQAASACCSAIAWSRVWKAMAVWL